MSNPPRRVIPREDLTAWERWELGTIDDPEPVRRRPGLMMPAPEPEPEPEPVEPPVLLPTAEEVEAIHQQAHQEGFEAGRIAGLEAGHAAGLETGRVDGLEAGRTEGFEAGHIEGLAAGRVQATDEVARLKALLDQLENFSAQAQAELAESVLDLALVMGRELARVEIAANPERVLPVIRELIDSMPVVRAPARILAHPDDLTALNGMLGLELPTDVWRIVADPNQTAGGFRVETPTSRVDLSLATRWAAKLRVLKRDGRDDLTWQAEVPVNETIPPELDALSLDLDAAADDEPL